MSEWSLQTILGALHEDIHRKLETARKTLGHPVAKGDGSEGVWLDLLQTYLPKRYEAAKAFVVDSKGQFSDQLDIVVFDRQYSPFIFTFKDQKVIPAESVYAVFESKQEISAERIKYAQDKVVTVRRLYRTSLPIPHAGGKYSPKPLNPIIGGLLTFESGWNPPMDAPLGEALERGNADDTRLDLGCVTAHGTFRYKEESRQFEIKLGGKPATTFLFNLISTLQIVATVPMLDVQAYGEWLLK